jgi:hypothetical protein
MPKKWYPDYEYAQSNFTISHNMVIFTTYACNVHFPMFQSKNMGDPKCVHG